MPKARLVALMVCAILTGCSDVPDAPDTPDPQPALPADIAAITYPLDDYQLSTPDSHLVRRARYTLVRRCVQRYKLDLPPMEDGSPVEKRRDEYGLADSRDARRWGYTLDWDRPTELPWEARIPTDGTVFVLVNGQTSRGPVHRPGLPAGGCRAEARRALDGTARPVGDPVPGLRRQAWSTSRESPGVTSAERGWHTCMARAGYRYQNPVEAPFGYWSDQRMRAHPRPTPEQRRYGIPPSAPEIAAALADLGCKRESGFLAAWIAENLEHQRQLVTRHRAQLTAHRQRLDATVARARRVLSAE